MIKNILYLTIFILLSVPLVSCTDTVDEPPVVQDDGDKLTPLKEVPAIRLERLSRGVNLGHWFAQTEISSAQMKNRFSQKDMDFLSSSGFKHVRLSVNEEVVYDKDNPSEIKTKYLSELDKAISDLIEADVAVIFDFHPNDSFKDEVVKDIVFANSVKIFWGAMAKYLTKYDADMLYLEVMNEPMAVNASEWYDIQKTWVPVIRRNAPEHTIILDGNLRTTENNWNDVEAFILQEKVSDPNVVYNFHFYMPMAFTHQAATWGWEALRFFEGLIYPPKESNVNSLKTTILNQEALWGLDNYLNDAWDADKIANVLDKAAKWAEDNNAHITCNEFGVYDWKTPKESRLTYMSDVREILEKHDIGWSIWEYDDGFGVVQRDEEGNVTFEEGIETAVFK